MKAVTRIDFFFPSTYEEILSTLYKQDGPRGKL